MSLELSQAERSIVKRLAEDPARNVKPGENQRYHTVESPEGARIGHRVQARTIHGLIVKGFLSYANGRFRLSHAGRKALEADER